MTPQTEGRRRERHVLWEDTDLSPEEILGRHQFEDVLFTPEKAADAIPVSVVDNESVAEVPTPAEARELAEGTTVTDRPYVAVVTPTETMIEVRAGVVTRVVFCHRRFVGGMDRQRAFLAAYDNPAFEVSVETDYETGDLAITVGRADVE